MTINEWSARWKRNDDFPECLKCRSNNTKEHHFTQVGLAIVRVPHEPRYNATAHGQS